MPHATVRHKKDRIFSWSLVIILALVVCAIGMLAISGGLRRADAETAAEFRNTKQVFTLQEDGTEPLLKRVDGSFYTVRENSRGVEYEYTTADPADGSVVKRTAPVMIRWESDGRKLWRTEDVVIKAFPSDDENAAPRIERHTCSLAPIDSTKPSHTGDPYAGSAWVPGSDEMDLSRTFPLSLLHGEGSPLCVDRVVIFVPEGTVQP